MASSYFLLELLVLTSFLMTSAQVEISPECDIELLQFGLNMKYLEAEFFLFGALGYGLDVLAPDLTQEGPAPLGAQKANLQWFVRDIVIQLAYQEIGHLRAIRQVAGGFPRPLLDFSATHFAELMNNIMGVRLRPSFNPYLNDINFLLASYLFPYISTTSYVGSNSYLNWGVAKRLSAGIAAVEAGQDAIIRSLLYERALQPVYPYRFTVAEITRRISTFRNRLEHSKMNKDAGIIVGRRGRRGGFTYGNIVNADQNSVTHARLPGETLRILYRSGNESRMGGFFPMGANGTIARAYLSEAGYSASTSCGFPLPRNL